MPFSEDSLQIFDHDNKRPTDYVKSESLKRIFNEHFDSSGGSGGDLASQDTKEGAAKATVKASRLRYGPSKDIIQI